MDRSRRAAVESVIASKSPIWSGGKYRMQFNRRSGSPAIAGTFPDGCKPAWAKTAELSPGGKVNVWRLDRAMLKNSVRLVVLDEPFHGLERKRRQPCWTVLASIGKRPLALCDHDIAETPAFDRVLVVDSDRL